MKRILTYCLLLIGILLVVFYFWASASNLQHNEYLNIETYNSTSNSLGDTLSICTYNIGYLSGMTNNRAVERTKGLYDNNLADAIKLFQSLNPDFIAFQEIDFDSDRSYNTNQMNEIAQACYFHSGAMAVNWDKKYVPFPYWPPSSHFGEILSGQAVLSKTGITNNDAEILIKPESNPFYYNAFYLDRLAQTTILDVDGEKLVIINVHLEAWDYVARAKQVQVVIDIFNKYAKDYPVLLVGDFNSTPPFATTAYQPEDITTKLLFETELLEAAISKDNYLEDEKANFTFSSEEPSIKIDYIFYNQNKIEPVNARVVREAGQISDHLPVFFQFKLK